MAYSTLVFSIQLAIRIANWKIFMQRINDLDVRQYFARECQEFQPDPQGVMYVDDIGFSVFQEASNCLVSSWIVHDVMKVVEIVTRQQEFSATIW